MHTLSLKSVFKEAWNKVAGTKKTFFFVLLIFGVAQLIFFSLKESLTPLFPHHLTWLTIAISILSLFILAPVIAGFYMLGVRRAYGETIHVRQYFAYFPKILSIFLVQILNIATIAIIFFCLAFLEFGLLGFLYNHVPSILFHLSEIFLLLIYLTCFLTVTALLHFVVIVMLDQNKSPWQAYKISVKTALPYSGILFFTQFVFVLAQIIGALLFGVGLLWAIPFIYIGTGILYREIFKN